MKRSFCFVIIGLISIVALSSSAWSWPDKTAQSLLAQTNSAHANKLILAHYFHKTDPRQTFAQYAKSTGQTLASVKQQFSATGVMKCFGIAGRSQEEITAQVVGRQDLIAGAAHVFFNDDCTPREVHRCEFHLISQPRRIFKIDTIVIKACVRVSGASLDDWFVAELKARTPATPYLVPQAAVLPTVGNQLVQVAAEANNGFSHTPNIVACTVRDVSYRLAPYLTDCSTGHGASGAAQLQPSATLKNRWVLDAIVSAESPTGHDGGEFNVHGGGYTTGAPVNGEFWQALADKLRGTPEAFEKIVTEAPCQNLTVKRPQPDVSGFIFRGMTLGPMITSVCRSGVRFSGILVSSVEPFTAASDAGFESGDLISSVDDQVPNSLDEFKRIVLAREDRHFIRVGIFNKNGGNKQLLLFNQH
jgi:hypothetical protein